MIHDLVEANMARVERRTEICVVGAGVAGLFLAHLFREYGLRVAVLEAGGMASLPVRDYGVECLQSGRLTGEQRPGGTSDWVELRRPGEGSSSGHRNRTRRSARRCMVLVGRLGQQNWTGFTSG